MSVDWSKRLMALAAKHCDSRWYGGTSYPFCFYAKMHESFDFDKAFQWMSANYRGGFNEAVLSIGDMAALRRAFEAEAEKPEFYDLVLEDMRRTFTEDDTMRTIRPALAKRYRIPYPENAWLVEYSFVGRSGGWLSLDKFEGHMLATRYGHREDVVEEIKQSSPRTLKLLCAMIEEVALTLEKRNDEFHYQAGFQLALLVER